MTSLLPFFCSFGVKCTFKSKSEGLVKKKKTRKRRALTLILVLGVIDHDQRFLPLQYYIYVSNNSTLITKTTIKFHRNGFVRDAFEENLGHRCPRHDSGHPPVPTHCFLFFVFCEKLLGFCVQIRELAAELTNPMSLAQVCCLLEIRVLII